jgi:flagellar hook-associated protein 2
MAGISTGTGLASGIDYTTMISQLMQIEGQPRTLLKTQLSDVRDDASAYRRINTALASLSSAAQALTGDGMTSARKASSSSTTVTATAGATAVPGNSVSFTVKELAAAQTVMAAGTWSSAATGDVRTATAGSATPLPTWPLTVVKGGKTVGTIKLPATATPTLNDAAAAINKSGYGLSATVVKFDGGYKLQITSSTTGKDGEFKLLGPAETDSSIAGAGSAFTVTTAAKNAELDLGNAMTATSSSNTFTDLLTGVSLTVSAKEPTATTITVANDTSAVTAKVKAMMDAANTALSTIGELTRSTEGSDAVLKGNWTLTNLASQIRSQVSSAVGGRSPAQAGITLERNGTITFTAAKFSSALAADPEMAQKILGGSTGAGVDNVDHTPDDPIVVDGIAARMSVLAERASDSATGMITTLATSQDTRAKDLQKQIDAWDLRLASRKATLTAQFNAMEKALGTLQNQASWLTSQLSSLPSWSKSNS